MRTQLLARSENAAAGSCRQAVLAALLTLLVAVWSAPLFTVAASDHYFSTLHGRAYPLLVILVPLVGGCIIRGWPLVILPVEAMVAWFWVGHAWINAGHEIPADTTLLGLPRATLLNIDIVVVGFTTLFIAIVGWLLARMLAPRETRRTILVRLGLFIAALVVPVAAMIIIGGGGQAPGALTVGAVVVLATLALPRWEFVPVLAFLVWAVAQVVAGFNGEGLNDELPIIVVIPIMVLAAFSVYIRIVSQAGDGRVDRSKQSATPSGRCQELLGR